MKSNSASPRLRWLSQNVRGHTIVDIGFAGVYQTDTAHQLIRQHNPKSLIIPVDIDADKVHKFAPPNAVVGDGFALPVQTASVDSVVIAEVLEHVWDWTPMVKEAARTIKPGGQIVITTPSTYGFFRWLKHWLLAPDPAQPQNVTQYLGFHEHVTFIDPISLVNVLHLLNFTCQVTTTNLSLPYLPKKYREPDFTFWPLNRLGTYTCINATKQQDQ